MEYFPLGDLNQHIKQNPLAENDTWDITAQLLDALVIMHAQHFTHRDIKPAVSAMSPMSTQTVLLNNIITFLSRGSHPDGG
jgi:serine/threonine protein kinase